MFVQDHLGVFGPNGERIGAGTGGIDLISAIGVNNAANNRLPKDFIGSRRPFVGPDGRPWVLVNTGQWARDGKGGRTPIKRAHPVAELINRGMPGLGWIMNASVLRPEVWAELDKAINKVARQPLVAYEDVLSSMSVTGFDAYAKWTHEYEAMSDPGEAVEDMDMLSAARHDNPLRLRRSVPLSIVHADFFFSDRFMDVSGSDGGESVDKSVAEAMTARVSERVEDRTIGNVTGLTYGTQSVGITAHQGTSTQYGFTNFTYRSTKTDVTTPTGSNPNSTVSDVLAMMQTLNNNAFYGPFKLYYSRDWQQYMNSPYLFTNGSNWAANPSQTLKQYLEGLDGISEVKMIPRLASTFNLILWDPTRLARAIDGRPPTLLQWDSMGGMRHNFKIWCIQVVEFLADYNQVAAEVHGTTS